MIVFGNRVLCLVVLFLLQSAGWMGMAQGEPLISVRITKHIYLRVGENSAPHATYDFSKEMCEKRGAYVLSGYTKAIRTEVMNKVYSFGHGENIIFYIGADAEYSVHDEPDPAKKCDYSVPSLNCIYKWNQGLWANALGAGMGVGFYQGSNPSVKDAGRIHGYDVAVYSPTALNKRPFIIRQKHQDDHFVFYLIHHQEIPDIHTRSATIVCEIQNGFITTTTEAPTAPTEAPTAPTEAPTAPTEAPTAPTEAPTAPTEAPTAPTEAPTAPTEAPTAPTEAPTTATAESTTTNEPQGTGLGESGAPEKLDDDSGWSNGLIAAVVILPILLVILAIVLCLYCCGCICRRKADGRRVTVDSKATIHIDRERIVLQRKTANPNVDTAVGNGMNPLLGEESQDKREIMRNTWMETPQQANIVVRVDNAVPSDSDAAAEQQTRRMSCTRSTSSDSCGSMSVTELVIQPPKEMVEGPDGEWLWGTYRTMAYDTEDVVCQFY